MVRRMRRQVDSVAFGKPAALAITWRDFLNSEVQVTRKRVEAGDEAVKRAGRRSTKASAKLESRVLPADHVRTEAVQRYLDQQRDQRMPRTSAEPEQNMPKVNPSPET